MSARRDWTDRARYAMGFVRSELRSKIRPPFLQRLRMLRRGFLSESYILYGFDHNDPALYLSDYSRFRCQRLNDSFSAVLENKIAFTGTFGGFVPVPPIRAVISKGRVIAFQPAAGERASAPGGASGAPLSSADDLIEAADGPGLVIKPFGGLQGRGVWLLRRSADELTIDGRPASAAEVRERIAALDECLVSDCLVQHAYAAGLFPKTVNTIRLYTMIDPADGQPFIPMAAQRIGTGQTIPTDNWSRGGIATMIDLKSGALGRACGYPRSGRVEWHAAHPETGAAIEGVRVERWELICREMLHLAARFPFMKFVGWDVLVTPEHFTVIEGNDPGFNLVQMHQPLLADERLRRCLRAYGIVR